MKWIIKILCLIVLLAPVAVFAECDFAWNNVAGHTYTLDTYTVQFSPSYSGPCPQGKVDVYNETCKLPILTCTYMTHCGQRITVTCGDTDLNFVYCSGKLVYVEFTDIMLELESDE